MSDLISRQAAIDVLLMALDDEWESDYAEERMREVPSAAPERKKGKWIRNFDGSEWYWYCSACKEQWYEEDLWMGGNDFPNFCPNCGADMRT